MGSSTEDSEALSDLEDGDTPTVLPISSSASNAFNGDDDAGRLKAALAELESERQARRAAETARSDLHATFTRLKAFTHEAVRQRDEAVRHSEDAWRSKVELSKQLAEAFCERDEAYRQRDDAIKSRNDMSLQRDDAIKSRDFAKVEIESTARLLVVGSDSITTKASSFRNFASTLPRSSSHTGLTAIAYGYTKRAEDIVEELAESLKMARSEMREQVEHHNNHSALEVSELEASVEQLKDDLTRKTFELEECQRQANEYRSKFLEAEQDAYRRFNETEKENKVLKGAAQVFDHRMGVLKASLKNLSQVIFKASEVATNVATMACFPAQPHKLNSAYSPSCEPEEGLQNCTQRLKEIVEVFAQLAIAWDEHTQLRRKELESLEGTITKLIIEKKEITNFLKSALANKQELLEAVSKSNVDNDSNFNTAIKSRESKIENITSDLDLTKLECLLGSEEFKTGEAINLVLALENDVKKSRQEIFELQQFLAVARGEGEWLRVTSERQAKALIDMTAKIKDLEEKQFSGQEKIEGLRIDLAVAEEEVRRWKHAAIKEAEAGATLLEEVERCQEQIAILKEQVRRLSQSLDESNSKLYSKEEMAAAAIAARNAAERSLQIADERAVQLRKRVEEMTQQCELLERRGDGSVTTGMFRGCWPYQWLRGKNGGTAPRGGAEMEELLEPFV